jgi:hypothetical protein
MLGVLHGFGRVKLNRVAAVLQDVARAGPLARWVCADVGTALLASYAEAPADLHHLLEVVRELLVAAGRALDPRCAPLLAPVVGRTKTGRLARALLDLRGGSAVPDEVRAEALAGRLARVRRWARSAA